MTKLIGLCAAVALVALPLYAHQDDTASLAIRFATESNQFKVGQIVPIELTFNAPTTYEFNTKSYDRSGRMEVDHFDVTPAGRDPLFVYYHDPMSGGWIGGGLSSMLTFDKQPQILERSLNEWVALDKAGHYSLRVTSGRVTGPQDSRERSFVLRSNLLEFDIVDADTQWQRQTLSQAVSALDNPNTSKDDNTQAEQTLRFLDSPESVRELTRQLTKPGSQETWNFMAGLLGARDQELVLKELESRFSEPDAALTSNYLWLVSKMQFARSHAPLPPYPEKDSAKQKDWQDEQAKLFAELDQARDAIYQRAADSLGLKKGAAKASTVATLLVGPRGLDQITRLPAAELTAAFPLLDEKQQSIILNAFSSRVLSPVMASPLEAILDKPKLPGTLRIDALQTLLTVNPQEGRVRILAEFENRTQTALTTPPS